MKKCYTCQETKESSLFGKMMRNKDGLQHKCKICKRAYDRKLNKDRVKIVAKIKIEKGCIDCGYNSSPAALQFDHIHSKISGVSELISNGYGLKKILNEIEKCEVRCANCHAVKTSIDFNWY